MSAMVVNGKAISAGAGSCRPITGNELRAVFFLLREGGIGLEAAAATGFVRATGADDDQLFAFDETLGVHRGIAAADADG